MIGKTFSTPSPGSRTSVSPGRSSPIAAITVWCVPWMTWGVIPSEAMCATMWSICSAVASGFITTITVPRPPSVTMQKSGERASIDSADRTPSVTSTAGIDVDPRTRNDRKQKRPRDLSQVPGPSVYSLEIERTV